MNDAFIKQAVDAMLVGKQVMAEAVKQLGPIKDEVDR
jgi:hypothetical protein